MTSAPSTASSSARHARLICYRARVDKGVAAAISMDVAACIVRTPYKSEARDQVMASTLYQYAAWVHAEHLRAGEPAGFNPASDLSESLLAAYRAHLREHSQTAYRTAPTYVSTLRYIRQHAFGLVPQRQKKVRATPPYSDADWDEMTSAVAAVSDKSVREEAQVVLALTGAAGLRPDEANRVTGTQITEKAYGADVLIANRHGLARTVPVVGPHATALLNAARSNPASLLRPALVRRGMALHNIRNTHKTRGSATFARFNPHRARHRWLSRLMLLPISVADVLYLADIREGNYTIADLGSYMSTDLRDDAGPRLVGVLDGVAR